MRTEDEESEAVVRYARCHYRLFDEKTLSVAVADLERELEEPMEPLKKPQVWKELLELFQQRLAELRQEDSNGDENPMDEKKYEIVEIQVDADVLEELKTVIAPLGLTPEMLIRAFL